jgi:DNA-directed RNA polymerase subunit K/omega
MNVRRKLLTEKDNNGNEDVEKLAEIALDEIANGKIADVEQAKAVAEAALKKVEY